MDFLVRFSQTHETFRLPELQACAAIEGLPLEITAYKAAAPFCLVRLPSLAAASQLLRRSILTQSIHELWGHGATLAALHSDVQARLPTVWAPAYQATSFKFSFDSFQGARTPAAREQLIQSFRYLPLEGPIRMRGPELELTLFDEWPANAVPLGLPDPDALYLGRHVADSARDWRLRYDLKKRAYISTTSMDAELALITANLAQVRPGSLVYDPFVGTGSFPIACAAFGALAFGSDIDGRSFRGDGARKSMKGNFEQYGLGNLLGDVFTSDLTNSPVRVPTGRRFFDAIVCDPPYGVREGLHVLGCRDKEKTPWVVEKGLRMWMKPDFVAPKKPYGFLEILDDILAFAAETLVDEGRLSFWMPNMNDEQEELPIPQHPCLEMTSVCVQPFNKWSRRLLTYRRRPDCEVDSAAVEAHTRARPSTGVTADELNPFRRNYFKPRTEPASSH